MLPPLPLSLLRLRLTLRVEETMTLPRWKGALLRGGLGRALRQALCDPTCPAPDQCIQATACPYRMLFAPDGEGGQSDLHGLRDVPRPYAVQPPLDPQTQYAPGDTLTFGFILAGKATAYVPHILRAFEALGQMGLGLGQGKARLIAMESLDPLSGAALPLLADGTLQNQVLTTTGAQILAAALQLPPTLTLRFLTPMRLKYDGQIATLPECHILVRTALRRLSQLCIFFGDGPWEVAFADAIAQAQQVRLRTCHTTMVDWGRTSGATGQHMNLSGFVGSADYANVAPEVRTILLAGSLVHIGKASVFGHGAYVVQPAQHPHK